MGEVPLQEKAWQLGVGGAACLLYGIQVSDVISKENKQSASPHRNSAGTDCTWVGGVAY